MERVILHIDFDSFFASCEQQFNPKLRGIPIGVTATNGRTCIIAASREAKRLGIRSPSSTYEAERIYPAIVFVRANFREYLKISKQFLSICKDYSPLVEMFSLDEVFMDMTATAHLFGPPGIGEASGIQRVITRIRERLAATVGEYITVSVGISYNKLLAKLASGLRKPNGMCAITPNNLEQVYYHAKLTDVCGIGQQIARRLQSLGVYSLMSLRQIPLHILMQEFGTVEGHFLSNIGKAYDPSPVIPYTQAPEVKSVGRNYCLPTNTFNQRVILQNVYELCEEVGIKLRRLGKKAKTVGLSLRGNRNEHGRLTGMYKDSGKELFTACRRLYDQWQWGRSGDPNEGMVRQISVWTGNLERKNYLPDSLFTKHIRQDRLQKTIDSLNDRFGDHTVRNGFLLYADKLTTVPNGFMADRYDRKVVAEEGLAEIAQMT